jgi:hypothetical protein
LAFFQHGATEGGGITEAIDPTDREELVMVGSLTVIVNQHQELCALHKPGGVPVEGAKLFATIQRAAAVAPQLLLTLEQVLHAHAKRLAEAAEVLRRTGRVADARVAAGGDGPLMPPSAPQPPAPPPLPPPAPPPSGGQQRTGGTGPADGSSSSSSKPSRAGAADCGSAVSPLTAPPASGFSTHSTASKASPQADVGKRKKKKTAAASLAASGALDSEEDEAAATVVRSAFDFGHAQPSSSAAQGDGQGQPPSAQAAAGTSAGTKVGKANKANKKRGREGTKQ